MLTASTLMVVSTAHVERDMLELELTVKVCTMYSVKLSSKSKCYFRH